MKKFGFSKKKINIVTSFLNQIITMACGVVVPHILLSEFGSDLYGTSVSITQFLSYITLLEGGIGGVARAALYGPLAKKDDNGISSVYNAEKHFFHCLSVVFIIYSILLGITYYDIAHVTSMTRNYIFFLVLIISISTLAQYMGGLTDLTLIMADQRVYISSFISIFTTCLNTLFILIMVRLHFDFLWVKLVSSLAFTLRPVCYTLYVKNHYKIDKKTKERAKLKQKWTGLGQHIAYFLHTNTDVMLLTILGNSRLVAVYSIYYLVVSSIQSLVQSFAGGMEALFGELFAKQNNKELIKEYQKYSLLLMAASFVLFGCTGILIVPFIRLYTKGITDANYIQPTFAIILILAESVNCMVFPSSSLPISANQLKETKWGAYGEAIINIFVSCLLIRFNPLIGVALGTLIATVFRGIYYICYSSKKILHLETKRNLAFLGIGIFCQYFVIKIGMHFIFKIQINNYLLWILYAFITFAIISCLIFLFSKKICKRLSLKDAID